MTGIESLEEGPVNSLGLGGQHAVQANRVGCGNGLGLGCFGHVLFSLCCCGVSRAFRVCILVYVMKTRDGAGRRQRLEDFCVRMAAGTQILRRPGSSVACQMRQTENARLLEESFSRSGAFCQFLNLG